MRSSTDSAVLVVSGENKLRSWNRRYSRTQAERKRKVLFIHGAEELVEGKAQNYLSDDNIARMAGVFHAWKDEAGFCRVVGLDEIEKNDFNLNIPRYVDTSEPEDEVDVAAELTTLKALIAARDEAERAMLGYLEELEYGA